MRVRVALIAALFAAPVIQSTAVASHNVPSKTKKASSSFVYSYSDCTGGPMVADPGGGTSCVANKDTTDDQFGSGSYLTITTEPIATGKAVSVPGYTGTGPDIKHSYKGFAVQSSLSQDFELVDGFRRTHDCGTAGCPKTESDQYLSTMFTCNAGSCKTSDSWNAAFTRAALPLVFDAAGDESNVYLNPTCVRDSATSLFACQGVRSGVVAAGSSAVAPDKGKQIKASYVRVYDQNSAPATESSTHEFGPKGSASVTVTESKGVLKVVAKATDVRNAADHSPTNDVLKLRVPLRITHNGCTNPGPVTCTRPDATTELSVPCTNGKCKTSSLTGQTIPLNIPAGATANVEIGDGRVTFFFPHMNDTLCLTDGGGALFACPGQLIN